MAIKSLTIEPQRLGAQNFRPPGFQFPVGLTFLGTDTNNVVTSFIGTGTWVAPPGATEVEYLVIAGGGAGGSRIGGGGGAGGFLTGTGHPVTAGTPYTITVGAGGAGATGTKGSNGADSVFDTFTSIGGGAGGGSTAGTGSAGV